MYDKKEKTPTYAVLWHEIKLIKQRNKSYLYILILLETICGGCLPLVLMFIPKIVIDYLTAATNKNIIMVSVYTLCGISLILSVISLLCNRHFNGAFVELRMKELSYAHEKYQKIDYQYLENYEFMNEFQVAIEALLNEMGFEGVYHNFIKLCPFTLSIILYCILISSFQPIIALVCIINAIISVFINRKIANYIDNCKENKAKARRQKTYFNNISYDFSYGKDIRIFKLSEKLKKDYKEKSDKFVSIIESVSNKEFLLGIVESIFILFKDLISYLFIIKGYFNQSITLGEVSLYVGIIIALSVTLDSFTSTLTNLIKSGTYASMYFKFINDSSFLSLCGTHNAIPKNETLEIEFKNVYFKYPNTNQWIFNDFNFKIEKGQKLAIVGINGAGKSTLVKLLTGLFPVTKGEININHININEFKQEEYIKMFSVVFQDIKIYACSILENIIGGDKNIKSIEHGITCLNNVGLKEKIESLPYTYDNQLIKIIDDSGIELSGGQNQKITIARALFKDANMVILDEPTAALDALSEAEIYESFNDLVGDKTAIYISHRLSSTKFCDKIAMFSSEGIIEYGSHKELMKLKGEYYHMFKTQSKYYQEEMKNERAAN